MPAFDTDSTESQLAVILDPEGRSVSIRVNDTPGRLVAQPRGFPLWFVKFSLAIPLAAYSGMLVNHALHRQLPPLHFIGLPLGCAAVLFFVALFRRMNQKQVAKGDFFILDKERKTLTLPRCGIQIRDGQVRAFLEVHAWHTVWWERRESSSEWLAELSVLVNSAQGEIVRYPVITCMRARAVTRIGVALADFFGVERRIMKVNWKTRRRLAAGRAAGA